jgi:hypothetical protein
MGRVEGFAVEETDQLMILKVGRRQRRKFACLKKDLLSYLAREL